MAKKDSFVLEATGGLLDPTTMCLELMADKCFHNRKLELQFLYFLLVLGDLLNKRPGAKKVGEFLAKQLQKHLIELTNNIKIKRMLS